MINLDARYILQLAVQHHEAGRLPQAEALYAQVLDQEPQNGQALHLLGTLAFQTGRPDTAADLIRRAIAIDPSVPAYHNNLGNALTMLGELTEAIAAYRQAIALRPNYAQAHTNLGNALKDAGELDQAIAMYRHALELQPTLAAAHSCLAVTLHFHPGYDAQAIYEEHCRWNQMHAEPLRSAMLPHGNPRSPDRRLKIGYVSPDFTGHVVGRFLLPLLAGHDRHQFEIYCYASAVQPDETTQQFQQHADVWRNVLGIGDERLAQLIRGDQIDILVDLTMHLHGNRLLTFAAKPAPVQVTYLAYCSTTGLCAMDYRLTDPYLDPPASNERWYSEKSLHLPHSYWCYQPVPEAPQIDARPLPVPGHVTFGCLNNFGKVSDLALQAWADVLGAVPNARLVLHCKEGVHRARVHRQMLERGISADRLDLVSLLPLAKYFELYQRIDIALDTFPYAGGTTTCDALWMGVPVVTLAGRTAVGRGGVSILSNVGLPELIGRTPEEYIQIAAGLAADTARRGELRATLRQRMERSALMDTAAFTRGVEAAYRTMWQLWCAGGLG